MLRLPFDEQWLTFWGGDTAKLNHHHENASQRFAFDFIQVNEDGGFFATDGKSNEDYYSFGKNILAPAKGVVIEVVDGVRDNTPGNMNTYSITGNYVIIKHGDKESSLLAHLHNGSTVVKVGDALSVGQKISECGNSGHSTDPYLHYQLQNSDIFARVNKGYKKLNVAKGIKVTFSNVIVERAGKLTRYSKHSPIKGDKVEIAQ